MKSVYGGGGGSGGTGIGGRTTGGKSLKAGTPLRKFATAHGWDQRLI